jgi:iron complex outermembrane receptor protein/hemoglobin/transferrin/lactoferrin receptor protein
MVLSLALSGRTAAAQTRSEADADEREATVRAPLRDTDREGRAGSAVTRRELDERAPRSTPDALRYTPGVSVQQTGHGQASPYVRGLTGQQVLLMFDGVRLNTGVYRQGPNQYLFTVDAQTVERLEVVRGSASVRWGSDALGGVVLVSPREPTLDPARAGLTLRPSLRGRAGTADRELGGRAELDAQLGPAVAVLVGGGYRDLQPLRAAGPVLEPATGRAPRVPFFEADGRTQRGTGFREATFDARVVARLRPDLHAVAALYGYRQFDAPRADQCPPPFGSERECLVFEEQFRTLAYAALRGDVSGALRDVDVTASYQRSHERRRRDRPLSFAVNGFIDDVDTLGLAVRAATPRVRLAGSDARPLTLRVRYGAEVYRDAVASASWITFTDVGITRPYSRGQYVAGATFAQLGAWGEAELAWRQTLRLRAGGRVAGSQALAPGDVASGTQPVDAATGAALGRVGVEWRPTASLAVFANVDQGFRAPNLDDLTSRQQAGPGFQFENPGLGPERTVTYEVGARAQTSWLAAEAWGFAMTLDDAITRSLRTAADCPAMTPQCGASWSRYQLVNAGDTSVMAGVEGAVRAQLGGGLSLAATVAWAWGEGPDPAPPSADRQLPRVPLSRVPPLNGTVEARWRHAPSGFWAGAALRWADAQTRLAPSDLGDARIPTGGTPGYAVADLRAGWRWRDKIHLALVLENLFDTPYRVHGSSVNGAGRSALVSLSTHL